VTKPHLSVIQEFCHRFVDRKDQILFRFTIGSCNSDTLKFWEPGATSFEERLEALKFAYHAGFKTSISSEPALDTNTLELVDVVLPFITDAIWIGLPNRLKGILKLNGADDPETLHRAEELMNGQSHEWIWTIYETLKDNPKVKWKDSNKKIVGINRPTEKGLDI
jgi:DNA repair photolyase